VKSNISKIYDQFFTLACRFYRMYEEGKPENPSAGRFYAWLSEMVTLVVPSEVCEQTGVLEAYYDHFVELIKSPNGIDFVTINWYRMQFAERTVDGEPVRSVITTKMIIFADSTFFCHTAMMLKNQVDEQPNDAMIAHHCIVDAEQFCELIRRNSIEEIRNNRTEMTFGMSNYLLAAKIFREVLPSLNDREVMAVNFIMEILGKVVFPVITDEQKAEIEKDNNVTMNDADRVSWPKLVNTGIRIAPNEYEMYIAMMNQCAQRVMANSTKVQQQIPIDGSRNNHQNEGNDR